MAKLMRVLRFAFLGLVVGYILALGLINWTWLDMRLNVALSLPIGAAAGGLTGLSAKPARGARLVLILEGMLLAALVILYGKDIGAVLVIPAVLLREGFNLVTLSLPQVNILLVIMLIAGNALWFFAGTQQEEK